MAMVGHHRRFRPPPRRPHRHAPGLGHARSRCRPSRLPPSLAQASGRGSNQALRQPRRIMRYFLPLLSCLAAFFVARHFRSALPARIAPVDPIAAEAPKPRFELSGLARRADRILSRDSVSAASLDQQYHSGNLSKSDLTTALFNAAARDPEGTWDWI